MKNSHFMNSKGFTIVEMLISTAIMAVVVLGGFQAYDYFNRQTSKEAKKMDDISEFNVLTKDLMSFTEGAGISTTYLNLPIKSKNCNDTEPCVRKLNDQTFINSTSPRPTALDANDCVQFYKDAKGTIESKLAYPSKPGAIDKIWENRELDLINSQELYATWILKDDTSPPFMMMKSRDSSLYLKQIRFGGSANQPSGLKYSFFESDSPKQTLKELIGYPFLVYNALYTNQYIIQYAHNIISCDDQREDCINLIKTESPNLPFFLSWSNDNHVSTYKLHGAKFKTKVYAIEFRQIDFNQPFFKNIRDRQAISSDCMASWGEGKQSSSGYFFPSSTLSVSEAKSDSQIKGNPMNILYLSKYATDKDMPSQNGIWVAVPIDIVTYQAEQAAAQGTFQLSSTMWHATDIKKKVKIQTLKVPFVLSRKIGTPEMGMWYNPIKK